MSNALYYNNQCFWHASNWVFQVVYESLYEIYLQNEIQNKNIKEFIESIDQETYGYGCVPRDLDKYLKTKEDYLILTDMVKKVIELVPTKYGLSEDDSVIARISEFYKNLLQLINSNEHIGFADFHE